MDDPLFLLMQGIWLLAAGMYPLGFLFGTCSACCGCPDECNKCSGAYYYDASVSDSICQDTFDSLTIESAIDSVNKLNVVPNGNVIVNLVANVLSDLTCIRFGVSATRTLSLRALFFENAGVSPNSCGCFVCNYSQQLRLIVSGLEDPSNVACEFVVGFEYDKCSQTSITATLTLTKEQMEACLLNLGTVCDDLPGTVEISVTFDLDFECECGACCRDGNCTSNEPEDYCVNNDYFYADLGNGTWQGVGTDCDPNECPQPGACCDGGECSETLEADCGGVFQGEGTSCDPNPCEE
jgi:hypothetical protein